MVEMKQVVASVRTDERIPWTSAPFFLMHAAALGVFFVPFSWDCVAICAAMYYLRMFGITAGFHRYFSHRGYKTGRAFQFVLAWLGCMSSQKGVLWWSGHHRNHHRYSDSERDIHSPKRGFWWSHMFWILCRRYEETLPSQLREFERYPEILFLNKYWIVGPVALGFVMFFLGGLPWLFWGLFMSTTLLWHGTFTINSLAHVWGSKRYETGDTSRNNFVLSMLTMGEGWHNNHHFYQSTANNGFFWWEIDLSFYILKALSWIGVVWDLRIPPAWVLEGKRRAHAGVSAADDHWAMPQSVLQAVEAVASLRAQIERAAQEAAESASQLRAHIAQRAAEIAESASKAAAEASECARKHAADLKAKWAAKAAQASEAAAQAAHEASEAAAKMAADVKTRVSEAYAEAASTAAKAASEAAVAAHKAAESVAPIAMKA
jgi:stearoyl-CoA desaturase (Delta-9 desaturase)